MQNLDLSFDCPHCRSQVLTVNNLLISFDDLTGAICPSCQYVISDDDVNNKLGYIIRQQLSQLIGQPHQNMDKYQESFSRS
jgi:Zn-finger nucleic acid-binding protein